MAAPFRVVTPGKVNPGCGSLRAPRYRVIA